MWDIFSAFSRVKGGEIHGVRFFFWKSFCFQGLPRFLARTTQSFTFAFTCQHETEVFVCPVCFCGVVVAVLELGLACSYVLRQLTQGRRVWPVVYARSGGSLTITSLVGVGGPSDDHRV